MTRLALALLALLGGVAHAELDKEAELKAKRDAASPTRAERKRVDARLRRLVGKPPTPLLHVRTEWTRDTLAFDPLAPGIDGTTLGHLLRCHITGDEPIMDASLVEVLASAALHFGSSRVEIISGYRAPKYNLMLRKKGHEVARDSQHTFGHAVDFRLPGVSVEDLSEYIRGLKLGGAGIYLSSEFVHADTGPIRTWAGR